jgi:ubiquinone/menaquinone biosynthesis C-methylase UbiE
MNKTFWDSRYAEQEYAYGIKPNDFLSENINRIKPGSEILCLAEGEGRNAVFLAERGHEITAIDYSESGLKKLNSLAKEKGVKIETICADLNEYTLEDNKWDAIICIFGHFPSELREKIFSKIYPALKKDGLFLLEAYSKEQVQYKTGGPQSTDLLYSVQELANDMKDFKQLEIKQKERLVSEGKYHQGLSSVIQIAAKK